MALVATPTGTINPSEQERITPTAADSNYILVQCNERLSYAGQVELDDLKVQIQQIYDEDQNTGHCTYLCRYVPEDLQTIRDKPFVSSAFVYPNQCVLDSGLGGEGDNADVLIFLHDDAEQSIQDVIQSIIQRRYASPESVSLGEDHATLTIRKAALNAIAGMDSVKAIESVREPVLHNSEAGVILGSGSAVVQNVKVTYTGKGQIVAVADGGLDRGRTDATSIHDAFRGRVKQLIPIGRPAAAGQPGRANDPTGHGTHVAASVLGDGLLRTGTGSPTPLRGTAPGAELIMQSMRTDDKKIKQPDNRIDLYKIPYDAKARVHNNSWGAAWADDAPDSQTEYGLQDAGIIDDAVWQMPDLVICRSAGNEGQEKHVDPGEIQEVSMWASAKNCITVGASFSSRPCVEGKYAAADANAINGNVSNVVAFSSRGPTKEGRIKPDVVAPGVLILSARSQDPSTVDKSLPTGGTDRGWYGISPEPQSWCWKSGTSMSTPLVAGCCAVLREALEKVRGRRFPSAALIKALLVHSAVDLEGNDRVSEDTRDKFAPEKIGPVPNGVQGFGRVDLAAAVALVTTPSDKLGHADYGNTLDPNAQAGCPALKAGDPPLERKITIPKGPAQNGRPPALATLKVTLAWSDPPGKLLQNKIEFAAKSGGETRYGNGSSSFDLNNVQRIVWKNLAPGDVMLSMGGSRVLVDKPQPFALVWSVTYP